MLDWGGLRFRLVLLVLMALLPVFGLFACSAQKNRQDALVLAQSRLQAETLLAAAHQQRLMTQVGQLLNDMTSGPSIKDTRIRLCLPYLRNLQAQDASYANLGVIGLDGRLTCHALDSGTEIFAGDRAYFKQVLATRKPSVGEYSVGRSSGRAVISFGAPVYSNEGVFNGVAFVALDVDAVAKTLAHTVASQAIMQGAQLEVLDLNATIVAAYPETQGLRGNRERDAVVLDALKARQPGVRLARDSNGTERVYAFAPVVPASGSTGLFVAISVPQEVITADPRRAFLGNLLALLGMTAFGVGCAWWAGGRLIVRPAQTIVKEADALARGDLGVRVNLQAARQGELGAIGASFNHLAAVLQTRRKEFDAVLERADKERALLNLIINSMSEGVIAANTEGGVLLFNDKANQYFVAPDHGPTLDDWRRSHQLLALDGKTEYPWSDRPLSQAARGISIDNWDVLYRSSGLGDRVLRVNARPLFDASGQLVGGVAVFNDITELKAAESFVQAQDQVLTLIASGASLPMSLQAIVELIEDQAPNSLCTILLVRDGKLWRGAAAGLPDSFMHRLDGLAVAPGVGACGAAAFGGEPVIVEDIVIDPLMQDFQGIAQEFGVRACWSTPVLAASGEVLATFAIYHRHPCKPQARDFDLLSTASRLARIALERARAEQALVSSEARFRELADNIQDVFYSRDARTGRMLYISPGYERIWGRSCESLYADAGAFRQSVLPEDQAALARADAQTAAGHIAGVEYRILTATGQTRWIRDNAYPVFNSAGALERVVGTARDVTDRKVADLALANSHRALQMLSRASIAVNRIEDETALLAEVCRVAVELGGYRMAWVGYAQDDPARSVVAMAHAGHEAGYLAHVRITWHEDDAAGQGPAGRAIRSGQPQQTGDISLIAEHIYWLDAALERGYRSIVCLPLRDELRSFGVLCLYAGEVQTFADDEVRLLQELADNLAFGIVSLRARLERRRSQEAAREAATKLREQAAMLDLAQDAIIVRDMQHRVLYWNRSAEGLYQWTAEEAQGRSVLELMKRPAAFTSAMAHLLAHGEWVGELEQRAKDGTPLMIEGHWTLVRDEAGQPTSVLAINTDIRKRKAAEQEILQLNSSLEERVQTRTAQLEFANKQLEAFSYSVSHDLRTPLSAIDGFSDLLDKNLAKMAGVPMAERSRHYLARIRAGVSQMGELIDAMLSLAQVARASLRQEPVDLSAMAQILLHGYLEREPGRVVDLHIEPGLTAQGDPRLLQQVLGNLLGNAWKFSARRERAEIWFGRQSGGAGDGAYFVRDNGAGFDMTYAEKLFGAFQRLHTTSEFAGTGIGLATAQRIISRHGGRIWALSAPDQGATFYFTLGTAAL